MKKIIVLAGGTGERFGSKKPKQFHDLGKKMLLEHVLDSCNKITSAKNIYIVCHEDWVTFLKNKLNNRYDIIPGGKTRIESTLIAFRYIDFLDDDYVFLLESNRPLTAKKHLLYLTNLLEKNNKKTCAIYVNKVKESLLRITKNNFVSLSKSEYFISQTPYLFKGKSISKILTNMKDGFGDDLDLLSFLDQKEILPVQTDFNNIKVTTKQDYDLLKKIYAKK